MQAFGSVPQVRKTIRKAVDRSILANRRHALPIFFFPITSTLQDPQTYIFTAKTRASRFPSFLGRKHPIRATKSVVDVVYD